MSAAKRQQEVVAVQDKTSPPTSPPTKTANIVLVAGFEAFNLALYKKAAEEVMKRYPGIRVSVFTDREITSEPQGVSDELARADVFFGSLVFDYDQVGGKGHSYIG